MSAMIMSAMITMMMVIMVVTINSDRHYGKSGEVRRVKSVIIRWIIRHISR
ncbi:hypothetical protein D3C86_2088570 [compost metagenome]